MSYNYSQVIYHCLLLLLCISTSNAQTESPSDRSSVEKIIEEKNKQYFVAIEKNDVKAFESQFMESSWIMVSDVPVYCGPSAIEEYYNAVLSKKKITGGKSITIDLYGIGTELVAEVGFYQFYNKANEQVDDGKFIVIWKRVDGQWKRLRQTMVSSRPNGY